MVNRETVDECIEAYAKVSQKVFKIDQVLLERIPTGDNQCRFDHNVLEAEIKAIVRNRVGSENCSMSEVCISDLQPNCRTFVVAKKALNLTGPPTIFRSHSAEQRRASNCAI